MGAFIVVEGIDGSGKTTVCRAAAEALCARGIDAVVTAEPTHEGIGAFIRSGDAGSISQLAESLLFTADRVEHTAAIRRTVADGRVVICDRYYASTIAYQSSRLGGDAVGMEDLMALSERFVQEPDAVILLDMDPRASMDRVGSRGEEESKFENLAFQEQVRARYLELADRFGYEVVDASRSREDVLADVMRIMEEVLRCIRQRRYTARRARSSEGRRSSSG